MTLELRRQTAALADQEPGGVCCYNTGSELELELGLLIAPYGKAELQRTKGAFVIQLAPGSTTGGC